MDAQQLIRNKEVKDNNSDHNCVLRIVAWVSNDFYIDTWHVARLQNRREYSFNDYVLLIHKCLYQVIRDIFHLSQETNVERPSKTKLQQLRKQNDNQSKTKYR